MQSSENWHFELRSIQISLTNNTLNDGDNQVEILVNVMAMFPNKANGVVYLFLFTFGCNQSNELRRWRAVIDRRPLINDQSDL